MAIDFKKKIHASRNFNSKDNAAGYASLVNFESDRGRIINSAAVRRLQQKTQVFPLERNAAVRSRLTHSLEVQQVGRFIVQSVFKQLSVEKQQQYGLQGLERQVESLVEMACMLHDVGNPPFGHSGESAINAWFSKNLSSLVPFNTERSDIQAIKLWRRLSTELANFEGNAQAIRLVHSLQNLNLTYSQVACILKYTRPAYLNRKTALKLLAKRALTTTESHTIPQKSYLMKKPGFYYTEQAYVEKLWAALETEEYCRHPLTYIMEAADDISYCLADLEDAVEKGILSLQYLTELLKKQFRQDEPKNRAISHSHEEDSLSFSDLIDKALTQSDYDVTNKTSKFFISLRVGIIHPLVSHATQRFIDNIEQVYHGTFNQALLEDNSQYHAITKTLKSVAQQHVFSYPEVEMLELQGFRIIAGLLEAYKPLLQLTAEQFQKLRQKENSRDFPLEARLLNKLPNKHLAAYDIANKELGKNHQPKSAIYQVKERYYRCRLLQDNVSGMTDNFAADEYNALVLCQS